MAYSCINNLRGLKYFDLYVLGGMMREVLENKEECVEAIRNLISKGNSSKTSIEKLFCGSEVSKIFTLLGKMYYDEIVEREL